MKELAPLRGQKRGTLVTPLRMGRKGVGQGLHAAQVSDVGRDGFRGLQGFLGLVQHQPGQVESPIKDVLPAFHDRQGQPDRGLVKDRVRYRFQENVRGPLPSGGQGQDG